MVDGVHRGEGADGAIVGGVSVTEHDVKRHQNLIVAGDYVRIEDTIEIEATVADADREVYKPQYLVEDRLDFILHVVQLAAIYEAFKSVADDRSDCIDDISGDE